MLPPYKIMIINKKQLIIIIVIKIVTIIYQITLYIIYIYISYSIYIYNIILYMYISLYNYIYIHIINQQLEGGAPPCTLRKTHRIALRLRLILVFWILLWFVFLLGNFRYSAGNRNSWCISNTCVSAYKWPIFHCEGQGSEGVLYSKPFFPTISWFTTCR
jgi:hypothetical protein